VGAVAVAVRLMASLRLAALRAVSMSLVINFVQLVPPTWRRSLVAIRARIASQRPYARKQRSSLISDLQMKDKHRSEVFT